jgi:hypothetical protein
LLQSTGFKAEQTAYNTLLYNKQYQENEFVKVLKLIMFCKSINEMFCIWEVHILSNIEIDYDAQFNKAILS